MSLLTDASLIVTPNGYNKDKLYSVIPNTTLGDMVVTRGSSATRVNSAKLIEIARTNLLIYSNTFSDASWTKTNITVTANATTAPDLTLTANKLTITTTFGNHQINRLSVVASSQCAMSIYAKADGVNTLTILDGTGSFGSIFNLSTVTVTNVGTGVGTMVSVGGGWYRCITIVTTTGFRLYCPNTSSSAGDGTSGIYIWGAQLELGETATEYIPTTTVARTKFAGITQDGLLASNIPRIDYPPLGGCPKILVEPARTNEISYSEEFDNAIWNKTNIIITANVTATLAPDGSFTADKFIPDATNGGHFISRTGLASYAYTFSVFAKAGEETTFSMWLVNALSISARFDLSTGTYTVTGGATGSMTAFPNGWYRCSVYNATPGTTAHIYGRTGGGFAGDGVKGIFLWGAQVEIGSNATSYIPTTTAALPRAADVIRNLSATTLIGQTAGTLFVDVNFEAESVLKNYLTLGNSGTSYISILARANNKIGMEVLNSGVQVNANSTLTYSTNQRLKIAMTYKLNDFNLYVNGVLQVTDTSGTVPATGAVILGSSDSSISQATDGINLAILWKTALTDDQCILLTGPSFSSYPEMANNFPNTLIYSLQ